MDNKAKKNGVGKAAGKGAASSKGTILKVVSGWSLGQKIIAAALTIALACGAGTVGANAVYNSFDTTGGVLASISTPELENFEDQVAADVFRMVSLDMQNGVKDDIITYVTEHFSEISESSGSMDDVVRTEDYKKMESQLNDVRNNMVKEINTHLKDIDISELSDTDIQELSERISTVVSDDVMASPVITETENFVKRDEISNMVTSATSSELKELKERLDRAQTQIQNANSNYNALVSQVSSALDKVKDKDSSSSGDVDRLRNSINDLTTQTNDDVNKINRTIDNKLDVKEYNQFLTTYSTYITQLHDTVADLAVLDARLLDVEKNVDAALKAIENIGTVDLTAVKEEIRDGMIDDIKKELTGPQKGIFEDIVKEVMDENGGNTDISALEQQLNNKAEANKDELLKAVNALKTQEGASREQMQADLLRQINENKNLTDSQKKYLEDMIKDMGDTITSVSGNAADALDKAKATLNKQITDDYTEILQKIADEAEVARTKAAEAEAAAKAEASTNNQTTRAELTSMLKTVSDNLASATRTVKVSFDLNCNEAPEARHTGASAQIVTVGQTIQRPTDPVREGFTFDCWSTKKTIKDEVDFSEPVANNVGNEVTIYAMWRQLYPINYGTVIDDDPQSAQYGLAGAYMTDMPSAYSKGDKITLADPSWSGYTFVGWSVNNSTTTAHYNSTALVLDDIGPVNLYAHYTRNNRTIVFDWNPQELMKQRANRLAAEDRFVYPLANDDYEIKYTGKPVIKHGLTYGDATSECSEMMAAFGDSLGWPTIPETQEVYGYYFNGWYITDNSGNFVIPVNYYSTVDLCNSIYDGKTEIKLKAKWSLSPYTSYKVNYCRPHIGISENAAINSTNYNIITETQYAPAGQKVQVNYKHFDGFDIKEGQSSQEITLSGNSIDPAEVNFEYTRHEHNLSLADDDPRVASGTKGYYTYRDGETVKVKEITSSTLVPYMDPSIDEDAVVRIYAQPSTGYKITGFKIPGPNGIPEEYSLASAITSGNLSYSAAANNALKTYDDANGATSNASKAISFKMPDGNATVSILTAGISYKVKYVVADGKVTQPKTMTYGRLDSERLMDIKDAEEDTGYSRDNTKHFIGWSLSDNKIPQFGSGNFDNANKYTAATDTLANSDAAGDVSLITNEAAVPHKKLETINGTAIKVGGLSNVEDSEVTLYACWANNAYTVTAVNGSDINKVYNIVNGLEGTANEQRAMKDPYIVKVGDKSGVSLNEIALKKNGNKVISVRAEAGEEVRLSCDASQDSRIQLYDANDRPMYWSIDGNALSISTNNLYGLPVYVISNGAGAATFSGVTTGKDSNGETHTIYEDPNIEVVNDGGTYRLNYNPSNNPLTFKNVYPNYGIDEKWTYDDDNSGVWVWDAVKEDYFYNHSLDGKTVSYNGTPGYPEIHKEGLWPSLTVSQDSTPKIAHFDGETTSYGDNRHKNMYTYQFGGWEFDGLTNDARSAIQGVSTDKNISFNMPANAITARNCGSCLVTKVYHENIKHKTAGDASAESSILDPLIGQEVYMGRYVDKNQNLKDVTWIVAEKLDDGIYALQSEGVSKGYNPVYIERNKGVYQSKSYGVGNYAYKAIPLSKMDSGAYDWHNNLYNLYDYIKEAEADGGRIDDESGLNEDIAYSGNDNLRYKIDIGKYVAGAEKDGLYLVSATQKNSGFYGSIYDVSGAPIGSGNHYHTALRKAAANCEKSFSGTSRLVAWLGSLYRYDTGNKYVYAWGVKDDGTLNEEYADGNACQYVIAPAFNVDVSKINLVYKNGKAYMNDRLPCGT